MQVMRLDLKVKPPQVAPDCVVPFQGRYEVAVGRSCGGPRGQVGGQGRVLGSPPGLDLSTRLLRVTLHSP